jgi:hypothetical protein
MRELLEAQARMSGLQERVRHYVEGSDQFRAPESEEEAGSERQEKSARPLFFAGRGKLDAR